MTIWDDRLHMGRLQNSAWMLGTMDRLLGLQSEGRVLLSGEGYLRHPEYPKRGFARTVVMSAWVGVEEVSGGVVGAKFASSRPENLAAGLLRGRSVTILNDGSTGLPVVAYDGTHISNARTAAFATAAARRLIANPQSVTLIGAGRVHDWQARYMRFEWPDAVYKAYDPDPERLEVFCQKNAAARLSSAEDGFDSDVVSLATAGAPDGWIDDRIYPGYGSVWINTSLRDITPDFFRRFELVVTDDHDLCLQPGTPYYQADVSLHRNLCDLEPHDVFRKPVIVNPMGMAAWDVGFGYYLHKHAFEQR